MAALGMLVRASHPIPSLVVTAVAATIALAWGADLTRTVLVVIAVLSGQLSIGWSNDLIDAERDRMTHRGDKPVATGGLDPVVLRRAIVVALGLTVVVSVVLGWMVAVVHLGMVVLSGWAYNLGLKASALSPLPYALAFGTLPQVAVSAAHPTVWAPPLLAAAGACVGVAAHLLNALPDIDDDLRTGVRGLPHRMGARMTRIGAVLVLAVGVVLALLLARPGPVVLAGVVALLVVATVAGLYGRGRAPFVAAAVLVLPILALLAGAIADLAP